MISFKQFLEAVGEAYVYHWTPDVWLKDILRLNALGVVNEYSATSGAISLKKGWVSVTRSKHYQKGQTHETVRLVLDYKLLKHNYTIKPYADLMVVNNVMTGEPLSHNGESRFEAEEIVLGPIKPLNKYLVRIDMPKAVYAREMKSLENFKHFVQDFEHEKEQFKKGLVKLGPVHKEYPNQFVSFDKVSARTIERKKLSFETPSGYEKSIEELQAILKHPKLKVI